VTVPFDTYFFFFFFQYLFYLWLLIILPRLTSNNTLTIMSRRMLVRSISLMSSSECCRSLIEDNIVTCMLHLCFQTGDPTDSPSPSSSKSTSALDMLTTSDLITTLANFSHTGNTARMVRDGACGALVSLVQEFRGTNKSQNGRISCALRNLTCYLGNAQRMESDGVIEAVLVRNYIFIIYYIIL